MEKKLKQRDRISVSLGESIKEYGDGFDVHVSYSTDVRAKESVQDAYVRAERAVTKALLKKLKQLAKEGRKRR